MALQNNFFVLMVIREIRNYKRDWKWNLRHSPVQRVGVVASHGAIASYVREILREILLDKLLCHSDYSDVLSGVRKGRTHPLNFEQQNFFFANSINY